LVLAALEIYLKHPINKTGICAILHSTMKQYSFFSMSHETLSDRAQFIETKRIITKMLQEHYVIKLELKK
jgi:hypothetical protein